MKNQMEHSLGPARMSRSATGKADHMGCTFGAGAHSSLPSGTPMDNADKAGSPAWNTISKSTTRMTKPKTVTLSNRWEAKTRNPSGALNRV